MIFVDKAGCVGCEECLHVCPTLAIITKEEKAEIIRVALVRRGRHKQIVVGHRGQRLAELIGERFVVGAGRTHLVRLVHDDQVPSASTKAVAGVLNAGYPRYRRDDLILLLPGV
mgnify:CR=1 FL=1